MLEISNVTSGYGSVEILHGVSLEIKESESIAIIGANGAGKSTLLKTISGILRGKGSIKFNHIEILNSMPSKIVNLGLIHVPEGRQVFAKLTVEENLMLGMYPNFRKSRHKRSTLLEYVFSKFPRIYERKNQLAGNLSGGEQTMLAIGRGLMGEPKMLILDEPSLGLSPLLVDQIFDVLSELKNENLPILLVEQNADLALNIVDRGYLLNQGEILLSDTAESLKKNDSVREIYLGGVAPK